VIENRHGPHPFDPAGRLHIRGEQSHGLIEDDLVGHRHYPDVPHQLKRPACVVIRRRVLRRVVLNREIHVGKRAERLVASHDVGP
jgi:hypothetical protein